jgi:hypothetical protein
MKLIRVQPQVEPEKKDDDEVLMMWWSLWQ